MRKTNSFKLAVVAVGMLAIGTVTAQTNLDVTAVDNKGTIKTLKVSNGITSELTPDNTTTFKLGGILTEATTITSDAKTAGTSTLNIVGLAEIQSTDVVDLAKPDIKPAMAFDGGDGLTLMVIDESSGEIKKLLASDAAKFLSLFNAGIRVEGNGNPTTPYVFAVAGLPAMNTASANPIEKIEADSNVAKLFVYRNGVKLRHNTDFTVPTAGEITLSLPSLASDVIEVQFTN